MNPLDKFSFDRVVRSDKMTLLKLIFEAMLFQGKKLENDETIIETAITSILYDNALDNYEFVKYLVDKGAPINKRSVIMSIRAYDQSDVDSKVLVGPEKKTPSLALVFLMIDGTDIVGQDDMGENILMKAVGTSFYDSDSKRNEETVLAIAKKLVEKGAMVNVENCIGETVLSVAKQRAPKSTVDFLKSQLSSKSIGCIICKENNTAFCAGCKSVRYCSQKCQAEHWESHQKACENNI